MAHVTPSGGLNLRQKAKPGKVIKVLRKGTSVEILEEHTWLKVKTRTGEIGYVSADFIDTDIASNEDVVFNVSFQQSEKCQIEVYANSHFIGKTIYADTDFFPCLDRLNSFAKQCNIQIYVTSSSREPDKTVQGNIVKPASRSNHLIGHAIDMNIQANSGFFNSKMLKKSKLDTLPTEVRQFIQMIRDDKKLRWGGDFRSEDPVHIDDSFNLREPELWDKKLLSRK
ncbi:SH3 domain-containing protein [Aliikangiella sp. IMCC44359]|uniref:SH3 domain-containing protein n=1 Tax=Aliikangiella sp. IMCC44359 TaxID=3459125 RepID=UPI00403AE4A9